MVISPSDFIPFTFVSWLLFFREVLSLILLSLIPPFFQSTSYWAVAPRWRNRKLPVHCMHWRPNALFLTPASLLKITTILNLMELMPHVLLVSALLCWALCLWGFSVLLLVAIVGAFALLCGILLLDYCTIYSVDGCLNSLGLLWIGHYEHSCTCLGECIFWMNL